MDGADLHARVDRLEDRVSRLETGTLRNPTDQELLDALSARFDSAEFSAGNALAQPKFRLMWQRTGRKMGAIAVGQWLGKQARSGKVAKTGTQEYVKYRMV